MEVNTLYRCLSNDQGTTGVLVYENGDRAGFTMEPPWRDNKPNVSCIPPGEYVCRWHRSPRYGWVYLVTGVPGRSFVLTHSGNVGGDKAKGYRTHTLACILIGTRLGMLKMGGKFQRAVLASRVAVRGFFERMDRRDFILRVV